MKGFTFYREYSDLIDMLPESEQAKVVLALVRFMFDKKPIQLGKGQVIYDNLIRPLTKQKNKAKSKSKLNQNEINSKSNSNQNEIKNKSHIYGNGNINNNKSNGGVGEEKKEEELIRNMAFLVYDRTLFIQGYPKLKEKLIEWAIYKHGKGQPYTQRTFASLLNNVKTYLDKKFSEDEIVQVIDDSIANTYNGIIWKNLHHEKKTIEAPWQKQEITKEDVLKEEVNSADKEVIDEFRQTYQKEE